MSAQLPSPAELYEQFYGPAIFRPLAAIVLKHARPAPGERVLDVACGTGMVARYVAPMVGAQGRVVGTDINPAMLAVARERIAPDGAPIEWVQGDAVSLELPGERFDLVVCQQGLQFFSDRTAALRRMRQMLAPGGRIALALWQPIERQTLFAEFAAIEARHLEPLGVTYDDLLAPFSLGDPRRIRALLEESGFTRVEIHPEVVEARFPAPETFTRTMETAYGAVVPAFVEDRAAFERFVAEVERETHDIVARYSRDGTVNVEMQTLVALARRD